MSIHNCPKCTCLSDKELRNIMRAKGHTCLWSCEEIFNVKRGYTQYNCKMCDLERNKK